MTADTVLPPLDVPNPDRHSGQGERALWAAVIRQALDDLDYEPVSSRLYDQAAAFFLSGGPWGRRRAEIADLFGVHADDLARCGDRHLRERRTREGIPEPAPPPPVAPVVAPRAAPPPLPRLEATYLPKPKRGRPRRGSWAERHNGLNPFKFNAWRPLPSELADAAD